MLGAIYTGLSGMNAYSEGLMMISNDVANLNTLGYKGNFLSFNSRFSQGGSFLGSTAGSNGYGVSMGSKFIDFSQGQLQQTTNPLDLAIQGNGFLTLLNNGNTYYERTGNFFVDQDGFISDTQGNHLAVLDANGQTSPFNITPFKTFPPSQTTTAKFSGNLNASATDPVTQAVKVFDASGAEHDWTVTFTKTTTDGGDNNNWTVTVTDSSGTQVGGSGTLSFDGTGTLTSGSQLEIKDDASGLDVTLDFSAGVTSFSGPDSSIAATDVNGNAMGTLSGVVVTADGQIELAYSNGKTQLEGFVALANFQDAQQLQRLSGGLYRDPTGHSIQYHKSGADGVGTLQSGQVEASNVNLSSEFGELILIERGFQACSQIVSISNEMIQTLFGMRGQG